MAKVEILELHLASHLDFFLLVIDGKIEFTKEIANLLSPDDELFYRSWAGQGVPYIQNMLDLDEGKTQYNDLRKSISAIWEWKLNSIDDATPCDDPHMVTMIERAKMLELADD